MDKKLLLKYAGLLLFAVILFSMVIRAVSGTETLLEYAHKNPEIAYPPQEAAPNTTELHTDNITNEKPLEENIPEGNTSDENNSNENPPEGNTSEKNNSDENPPEKDASEKYTSNKNAANTETLNENIPNSSHFNYNENESSPGAPMKEDSPSITQTEDNSNMNSDRIVYKEGFYYEPLSDALIQRISGISYPVTEAEKENLSIPPVNVVSSKEEIAVRLEDLRYVSLLHYNFKGIVRSGELICHSTIAQDLVEIFYELYQNQYQIEQIHLIDEYNGDDTLSMQDNNTSCFNYRVVDGTDHLSKHALGMAIDINPFFNPYVVYREDGSTYVSPPGSESYIDRKKDFAYKIDEDDLCYKLFTEHGFTWGGHWNSMKDYQHFQKVPD